MKKYLSIMGFILSSLWIFFCMLGAMVLTGVGGYCSLSRIYLLILLGVFTGVIFTVSLSYLIKRLRFKSEY